MSKEIVELHQAFMWDCPECGIENFERAITVALSPEEEKEILREQLGDIFQDIDDSLENSDDIHGSFIAMPTKVTCKSCNRSFESIADDI